MNKDGLKMPCHCSKAVCLQSPDGLGTSRNKYGKFNCTPYRDATAQTWYESAYTDKQPGMNKDFRKKATVTVTAARQVTGMSVNP